MGKSKDIIIVGGGSAGWISAMKLLKSNLNMNITLIESKDILPIGVGEGTTPPFMNFIKEAGIDMRSLNATYKYGIHYVDWYHSSDSKYNNHQHPFNLNYKPSSKALHFEVDLLIEILKKKCISGGVKHITGDVVKVNKKDGNIKSVFLNDDSEVYGNYFIDCTEFKRVLISEMNPEIISYSDKLICDRAIITKVDEINDGEDYWTRCTALSSGWSWNIPLRNKTGVGYVYSSRFISDDEAKKEFNTYLGTNRDFKVIKWKQEALKTPFIKNCFSIGLSSGFLEPMEATNIHLILGSIQECIFLLKNDDYDNKHYNDKFINFMDDIVDYLSSHYFLSQRYDSKFWKYVSYEIPLPKNLNNLFRELKQFSDKLKKDNKHYSMLDNSYIKNELWSILKYNLRLSTFLEYDWLILFLGYNFESK